MASNGLIVVGAGIVGLATAWRVQRRHPDVQITILEKETTSGQHQTGHNSGVLHTGVYYKPGSLKATNCTRGRREMLRFCAEHAIAHEVCGKVIVATREDELPRLENLHARAAANGVRCAMIGPEELAEIEPHAAGIRALRVPEAGIVDYGGVIEALSRLLRESGAVIHHSTAVRTVREGRDEVVVETDRGPHVGSAVINCAGLHSDRVARASGAKTRAQIVPFRGEYYEFNPDSPRLCKHLIYPVPDPAFPFLGVHFTRMVGGQIEAGPNAVLALSREGYTKLRINLRDAMGTLTYPGFLRLALRHWRAGAGEMWRSVSKRAFVHALQRLIPEVRAEHLRPAAAGVRAQAISPNGDMVDDFLVEQTDRVLHVCNAPSPGATASLAIGDWLADRIDAKTVFGS